MKNPWKKLSSEIVHENPWYSVRRDKVIKPNGKKGYYHVIVRRKGVHIVAINEKEEVILVQNFRYPISRRTLEIPAGYCEKGSILANAKRELQEETGLAARKWTYLGKFHPAIGVMQTEGHIFLAQNLAQTDNNAQEDEGISMIKAVPFRQVLKMIQQGKITDGHSIASLTLAALKLKRLQ